MHRKLSFRRDIRLEGSFPAEVLSESTPIRLTCLDVSRGGAYLEGASYPPGTELQLKLELAPFLQVQTKATVVYQGDDGPPGIGVRFVELDANTQHEIRAFVETVRPLEEPLAVANWANATISTH